MSIFGCVPLRACACMRTCFDVMVCSLFLMANFSCRWMPIPTVSGQVLCIVISVREGRNKDDIFKG